MVVPEILTSERFDVPTVLIPGRLVICEPSPTNFIADIIPVA